MKDIGGCRIRHDRGLVCGQRFLRLAGNGVGRWRRSGRRAQKECCPTHTGGIHWRGFLPSRRKSVLTGTVHRRVGAAGGHVAWHLRRASPRRHQRCALCLIPLTQLTSLTPLETSPCPSSTLWPGMRTNYLRAPPAAARLAATGSRLSTRRAGSAEAGRKPFAPVRRRRSATWWGSCSANRVFAATPSPQPGQVPTVTPAQAESHEPSVVNHVSDFFAQHPDLIKGIGALGLAV